MNEGQIKILVKADRTITLRELFEGKQEARKEMAKLAFTEKIKALISLQEIAYLWGGKKDIIVWERTGK